MIRPVLRKLNLVNNKLLNNQIRLYSNVSASLKSDVNTKKSIGHQNELKNDLGHFDIVINGGGIVGLALLLNLQINPFLKKKRILLIEQQSKATITQSANLDQRILSNRVSSLTEASRQYFEKIGIWTEIKEYVKNIREMQIWSSSLNKAISFDKIDHLLNNVCYIVENNVILNALNRNLNHNQVLYSTNVVDIQEINSQINLFTKSKIDESNTSKLTCSLLIGCDGYNSLVREKSNLNYFNLPLDQNGVVGTVTMSQTNENNLDNSISFQRFLPNKTVVAILPLTDKESSFVISTSKEFAKKLVEMDEKEFIDKFNHLLDCEVENNFPYFTKNFEQIIKKTLPLNLIKSTRNRTLPKISSLQSKSRASFPLGFGTTLPNLVSGIGTSSNINLAVIGDSAHRIHPLAGQGLNLGIGDAMVLGSYLNASFERGEELFSSHGCCPLEKERLKNALNGFEKERQLKLIAMMSAIHSMQELFCYVPPILLNAFDHMDFIKKQIVIYANSV